MKKLLLCGSLEEKQELLAYLPHSLLAELDETGEWLELIQQDNKRCHNPENPYYDVSRLKDGDRVKHLRLGLNGTVTLVKDNILNITFVEVLLDNGQLITVFPCHIEFL